MVGVLRDEIAQRVTSVNELTEREVIAVGDSLNDIVRHATQHIGHQRDVLGRIGGEDHMVHKAIRSQTLMIKDHVADMSVRIAAHEECTHHAVEQVTMTLSNAKVIAVLAQQAKVLALNARIEAARAGDKALGFAAIAEEMTRLSRSVAETNERVQQLASELNHVLPMMVAQTQELRERADTFSLDANRQIRTLDHHVAGMQTDITSTVGASDETMAQVLKYSSTALSHLQFQDVAAQRLRSIDRLLEDALRVAEGAVPASPPASADGDGVLASPDEETEAGELLMF